MVRSRLIRLLLLACIICAILVATYAKDDHHHEKHRPRTKHTNEKNSRVSESHPSHTTHHATPTTDASTATGSIYTSEMATGSPTPSSSTPDQQPSGTTQKTTTTADASSATGSPASLSSSTPDQPSSPPPRIGIPVPPVRTPRVMPSPPKGRHVPPTQPQQQPPPLPSYDLTTHPTTSAPVNQPPLVPNPPPQGNVPPSAKAPPLSPPVAGGETTKATPIPSTTTPPQGNVPPSAKPTSPPVAGGETTKATPIPSSTTPPPHVDDHQRLHLDGNATAAAFGTTDLKSSESASDDDIIVSSDDPHELPIPSKSSNSQGGIPYPEPHDPIIHVTPPPTGGWRAGDLRQREQKIAEQQQGANPTATETASEDSPKSNSYISPHGPSEEFRRNASNWFAPPDLQGPMPLVDALTYRPSGAPDYWMPDAAHIEMLNERHREIHNRHVHKHGAGARTTRLAAVDSAPMVEIRGQQLFVEGKPFWIQGICYSPVPIGESVSFDPKGDYFTPDYAYIWQRDLPLIKAMGATTLRIYGWKAEADHTMFLDAVHAAGLKVLVTFYLGDAKANPVFTQDQRNQILINFVAQVHKYRDHPAILMWSFGNELNGAWNGFMKQFSDAFTCWWQAGCAGYSDTNSDCHWQSTCTYYQLFSWINSACRAAKIVTQRPIISGFADVDYMVGPTPWLDKVARFNYLLPDMDAWAVQLYRGWTFGGYFGMYRGESWKPMIVTEFGVDAYNDACGWPENNQGGCFNMAGEAAGGADDNGHFWGCAEGGECAKPGVVAQAEWDVRLANELMAQYVDRGGIVWGGFLMAWTDEFWKGGGTQDLCAYPCATWDEAWCRGGGIAAYRPGGSAMCSWKAHFTCPNFNTWYHDLCGYWLAAAPDNYVNEEWFGITTPVSCGVHKVNPDGVDGGYRLDSLYVRAAYIQVMQLWSGLSEVDTSHTSCDALHPCWLCSTTHTIDDLNDGACEKECMIQHLRVGPGSSVPQTTKSIGSALLHGSDSPDSFWSKFGLPIFIGMGIILLALLVSIYLWHRRRTAKLTALQQPLVRQGSGS